MIPDMVWSVVAGVFGLAVGSFLNVVIHRVPAGESVVRPPSKCPSCGASIRNRHNVPVFGWLLLRGRCYDCKAPISARYPLGRAAIGAATLFAFYFALAFAYPAGMGFGDVKLAGVLGALMGYLSWSALIVATFGAIVGVALIVTSRGGRKTAIPFGPFMIAFALVTVFAGSWLADGYLRLVGGG